MSRETILTPMNLISMFVLVLSSIFLGWWLIDRSQYIYVSDARVSATMISLSSRTPGWLIKLPIMEGTQVRQGDIIAHIDSRDAKLKLDELGASRATLIAEYQQQQKQLELTRKQLSSAITADQSKLHAAQASETQASVELEQARRELGRAESLLKRQLISEEEYDRRKLLVDRVVEALKEKLAESEVAEAELALSLVNRSKLQVLEKQLEMLDGKKASLDIKQNRLGNLLADHTIKSPIDGVIDEVFANQGEYVYPGQRILMLHNPGSLWIKANIKETNIRHIHLGALVDIHIDAFPDEDFKGKIINIGSSALSQFALLPSPNPSGNFTKVTQRLEVKIALDSAQRILKPGMMAELKIKREDSPDITHNPTEVASSLSHESIH